MNKLCANCGHVNPNPADGPLSSCPKCDGVYAKTDRLGEPAPPAPESPPLAARVAGAVAAVREARAGRTTATSSESAAPMPVAVVDVKMPFWSLVWFMVTAAIASIPALIFVTLFIMGAIAVSSGLLAGLGGLAGGVP